MRSYGGVFVDVNTVLLRDWRPLLTPGDPPWGVRDGTGPAAVGVEVLRLLPRPDAVTSAVLVSLMNVSRARRSSGAGCATWERRACEGAKSCPTSTSTSMRLRV